MTAPANAPPCAWSARPLSWRRTAAPSSPPPPLPDPPVPPPPAAPVPRSLPKPLPRGRAPCPPLGSLSTVPVPVRPQKPRSREAKWTDLASWAAPSSWHAAAREMARRSAPPLGRLPLVLRRCSLARQIGSIPPR
eukprot:scaffold80215_cov62-Phaeocystis_antarctica.AAC.2